MARVHRLSEVSSRAELAEDVEVGPFCFIESGVQVGPGCRLDSHVTIKSGTTLGAHLHGLAGDRAAAELGQTSVTAEDVLRCLGATFLIK